MSIVLKAATKTRVLEVFQEEFDFDPRKEFDNAFTMVCWHPRYILGDKHGFETPEDFMESDDYKDAKIIQRIYLYDHGDISISTSDGYPYDDPWDAGQVGFIYMTKKTFEEEFGRKCYKTEKEGMKAAMTNLASEVTTYNYYLTGQVYGWVLYKVCKCCGQTDRKEVVASSAGRYGIDDVKADIEDSSDVPKGLLAKLA